MGDSKRIWIYIFVLLSCYRVTNQPMLQNNQQERPRIKRRKSGMSPFQISLDYARWLYGFHTHVECSFYVCFGLPNEIVRTGPGRCSSWALSHFKTPSLQLSSACSSKQYLRTLPTQLTADY